VNNHLKIKPVTKWRIKLKYFHNSAENAIFVVHFVKCSIQEKHKNTQQSTKKFGTALVICMNVHNKKNNKTHRRQKTNDINKI